MLRISQPIYDALRQHGEETWPYECCGVLLGHLLTEAGEAIHAVEEAIRAENVRTDSAHNRYHIAPQELIRIQRMGRERGLDIVGFYHSHPDHPAQWSQTDLAEAHWLGCSYVITAVENGAARQTNSFLLAGAGEDDKRFEDQAVDVTGQSVPGLEPDDLSDASSSRRLRGAMSFSPINLQQKLELLREHWSPRVVAEMNNYQFKIVKLQGDFVWHNHPDTDEAFFVIDGTLRIDFRDGSVTLHSGELFIVPRGLEHKPFAAEEVKILLIEPRGVLNTGNAGGEKTAANDVWI